MAADCIFLTPAARRAAQHSKYPYSQREAEKAK